MKERWMQDLDESKAAQYKQVRQHWLYTFAGQAMQGMLAKCDISNREWVAEDAVAQARALLAELEKEPT